MNFFYNKFGSYLVGQRANKELDSVNKEINKVGTSIEGGAKWVVGKIKGSVQKPLEEFLKEYDLPVGIFPSDATNYEFDEKEQKLTVHIPSICEVVYKDSSMLRFASTVTGFLEKGKLFDIEGMKTKVMIWVRVSVITTEDPKVHFQAGLRRTRDRDVYEVIKSGVTVAKF